jgi:hypothetical protein
MPGPSNFNNPSRIISFAMKDAGLLQEGEVPDSDQLAQYLVRLNDLVNAWQTQGLKLWTNSIVPVTLTAGTGTYTLGPAGSILATRPMRVLEGYYMTAEDVSRPLEPYSWNTYNMLPNPTQQGAIVGYFQDKQLLNNVVKFWLVPDSEAATGSVDLLVQQQVTQMIQLNDTVSFPVEWYQALRWGLADDICGGQSEAIMSRCAQKASMFKQALEDWDVEDAPTNFQPDSYGQGRNPFTR